MLFTHLNNYLRYFQRSSALSLLKSFENQVIIVTMRTEFFWKTSQQLRVPSQWELDLRQKTCLTTLEILSSGLWEQVSIYSTLWLQPTSDKQQVVIFCYIDFPTKILNCKKKLLWRKALIQGMSLISPQNTGSMHCSSWDLQAATASWLLDSQVRKREICVLKTVIL